MKQVIRIDRAPLRKPEITQQGFYRADAHVARAGIYEYRNDDGSTRYELRPHDEVMHPESLASYDAAPVTLGHPKKPDGSPGEVTADNVRLYEVGTVAGGAREDDDHVAATVVVKDAKAIKRAKGGTQELSPGYRMDLEETAGADARYAYPGNPTGRYDAIQRNIRVNHVALVERARGGSTTRLRMDSADVLDDGDTDLTSIVKGHQHSINTGLLCCQACGMTCGAGAPCCPMCGGLCSAANNGTTSWAIAEGETNGHSHDWVRDDGVVTIAMNAGHTHTVLEDSGERAPVQPGPGFIPGARADHQFDRSGGRPEPLRMANQAPPPDANEQIRLLTIRADEADRVASQRADALATTTSERDGFKAELVTAKERIGALEAQIAAGTAAVETAALLEQRTRADAAERELAQERSKQPARIKARAGLEAKAMAVLGHTYRCDGMTDREILVAGIRHLRPKEDVGPTVSDDYLTRRFDALIQDRTDRVASQARAVGVAPPQMQRADNAPKPGAALPWRDQWQAGAGQFATRKDG